MKRKSGFTLVELLVVIAIISILAAIVVPNLARYLSRARATKALSEIKSIELALSDMLAHADRSNLNHFFNPVNVRDTAALQSGQMGLHYMTTQQFRAAQNIYTRTLYALLREGRAALADTDPTGLVYASVLRADVVKKLGTSYLPDLGFDPWNNLYQIFPGPWPTQRPYHPANPNIHRVYLVDQAKASNLPGGRGGGVRPDAYLTSQVLDVETDIMETVGYPPSNDRNAFIYSWGANLVSGQGVYSNDNYPSTDKSIYYEAQEPEFTGGGDDINNWDKDLSWLRFY